MIRKITQEDREKIKDILIETNNFNQNEIDIAMELIDIFMKFPDQKDYNIYIDEAEDKSINGYICYGPRPLTKGTFDLYWIAVNPKAQSRGIGSGLIKFMESKLSEINCNLILIETSGKPSYEKERKFYEKNKYEKVTEIKDFYDKGDSLVIYSKYLN
ncbi:MAG: GNAT family N-acetyltransferase [Ignavibacteria bacterium]|nr:GNAT family N-acetyltransferase [Ignavibacteria bacterium]